jgi:hypothetical protein
MWSALEQAFLSYCKKDSKVDECFFRLESSRRVSSQPQCVFFERKCNVIERWGSVHLFICTLSSAA